MAQKKKGFLRKIGRGVIAVAKTPRECMRIADQAIDLANHITDKSGLAKHFSGSSRVGVTRSSGRNGGTNLHYQQNHHSPTVGIGINNQGTPAAFVNNQAVAPLAAPSVNFHTAPAATTERHVQVTVPLQPAIAENTNFADAETIEPHRPTLGAPIYSAHQFGRTTDDFAVQLNVRNQPRFQSDSRALIHTRPTSQSRDTLASRTNIESHNLDKWRENYGGKPTVSRVMWMYATNQLLPKDRAFVARALGAGVVEGIRTGEEQTFGRVRAATGAVVSYFETDRAIRERYSQASGARVDMTSMSYAAPALARLATAFIPETPVELGLTISPAPVLFGASSALRCATNGRAANTLIKSSIKAPYFKHSLKCSGSGPAPGIISISPNSSSFKALDNYTPRKGIEFVFDPERRIFAVGKVKYMDDNKMLSLSFHQRLAKTINANENTVLGGTLSRAKDGTIKLTEHSGHYGSRWRSNDVARQEMLNLLSKNLKSKIDYTPWGENAKQGLRYGE